MRLLVGEVLEGPFLPQVHFSPAALLNDIDALGINRYSYPHDGVTKYDSVYCVSSNF
jgi:hypothetical protein